MQTPKKRRRVFLILITVLFVLAVTLATVYAYLQTQTDATENSFSAATDPEITVTETFKDNVKSNVAVKVGESPYSVYVRVAVVVTWKDAENGNVMAMAPVAGTDYTISLNTTDWFLHTDGYYYHKSPVAGGSSTSILINSCAPIAEKVPDGYKLNVEIVAQAIQSEGKTDVGDIPAVTDAWNVNVSGGKLTP